MLGMVLWNWTKFFCTMEKIRMAYITGKGYNFSEGYIQYPPHRNDSVR